VQGGWPLPYEVWQMTITSYATLKTAIADFLNRDDLTATIPAFISLAEARFNRDLRTWRQETRLEAQIDAQYSALPSDFLQPIRLQLLDAQTGEIAPVSTAQMMQLRSDRDDRAGRPQFYAITAQGLELFPTPDGEYDTSLVYYARIPALSDSNTTNWLLTEAPDVYLYGSLLHSAPYLRDDPRIAVWEALHATAVMSMNEQSDNAKYGGTGLKMKMRRGMP
jgi:hypothetical protein